MVTTRRVRCLVLAVPAQAEPRCRPVRPSELVPWSDPIIARLVHKLQAEVRAERHDRLMPTGRGPGGRLPATGGSLWCEAEIPAASDPTDDDLPDPIHRFWDFSADPDYDEQGDWPSGE